LCFGVLGTAEVEEDARLIVSASSENPWNVKGGGCVYRW
jgi:hypothetical protein